MKFRMTSLKAFRPSRPHLLDQDQRLQMNANNERSVFGERNVEDRNNMSELLTLLKGFVQASTDKKKNPINPKRNYEVQARDRQVFIDPPQALNSKVPPSELKLWISDVFKTVCSSAFNYLSKNQMSFEQAKIYCSQNILKNIVTLSQKYHLNKEQMEMIDNHIKKGVLNYLSAKYPLTDSTQINKKLQAVVKQVDNIQSLQNNYFTNSKIVFEYRQSGNYNDLIMMMINDLIGSIDSLSRQQTTNYQDFQEQMSDLFQKVTDLEWVKKFDKEKMDLRQTFNPMQSAPFNLGIDLYGDKNNNPGKRKIEDRDQYRSKVKEYTNYIIGRKTSENTPLYTSRQIQNGNLSIKTPQILRILTKWSQELFEKYNNSYFSNRSQSVKVQRGENINSLLAWMRRYFDRKLQIQKKLIDKSMAKLFKNNYQMQANILQSELDKQGEEHVSFLQKVCGKFSFKVVKNLHAYIIIYLNKLIHGLLKVSKAFLEENNQLTDSVWPSPPNLLSFTISDLMRCKFSSKQKQVLRIYEELNRISLQNPQKLKIVRIKNRLRMGTNDILMNIRFNDKILCEIQLAIIIKNSDFIKRSNSFQHYLYELQRSIFGPLTELCSIWNSLDRRSNIYEQLVDQQQNKQLNEHECVKANKNYEMKPYQKPFICSRCKYIYTHNLFPKQHTRCNTCSYLLCAKCSIQGQNQENLKKMLGKDELIHYCGRRIFKEDELPKFGICTLIETKVPKVQLFTWVTYRNNNYLLGKKGNQLYQIYSLKTEVDKQKFKKRHLIFQLLPNEIYKPIQQQQAINKYIIPFIMKKSFQQEKESVNLMDLGLNTEECKQILSLGTRSQKQTVKNMFLADNSIEELPFVPQEFPNLQWITLSRNRNIKSIKGIEHLKELDNLIMSSCFLKQIPSEIFGCKSIQQLSFQTNIITKIDDRIAHLQSLKYLEISFNKLKELPQSLLQCKELRILNVEKNQLEKLPQNISKLQNLEALSLSSNKITMLPQSIGQLRKLKKFYINFNKDLNYLPQSFSKLKTIEHFDISSTNIGDLPMNQEGWPCLKQFTIGKTKIRGLPVGFKCIKGIQIFNINELPSFSFENVSLQLVKSLNIRRIDLRQITPTLIGLRQLRAINISNNSVTNLQLFFKNLELLQNINIQNCKLTSLPNFSQCHNLKILNISSNMIENIPSQHLQNLQSLQQFLCSKNSLTSLPISLTKMTCLKILDASRNEITNLFSTDFQQSADAKQHFWPNLKEVFLNSNKLEQIPLCLCYCQSLIQLNILSNRLKRIRPEIKNMINLNKFNANNNVIFQIPKEMTELTNLEIVYLQNNQIGNIPECLRNMRKISCLSVTGCPVENIEPVDWVLSISKTIKFSQNLTNVSNKMRQVLQKKKSRLQAMTNK